LCSARQLPQWDPLARSDQQNAECPWGNPPSEARVKKLWRALLYSLLPYKPRTEHFDSFEDDKSEGIECVGCAGTWRKPVGRGTIRRIIRADGKAFAKILEEGDRHLRS